MAETATIDVGEIVDRQKVSFFLVVTFAIAWLEILIDAYDLFVPGFVAPELIKSWHIAPASLGPMFSATLLGIVIGAPVFGWIGDRYGRKKSIIFGSVLYGLLSLASMEAMTISQLSWLRLLTGIALGGIIPNSLALAAEFAPRRIRASMVLAVGTAAALGLLVPGLVAALYIAAHGWQILFLVGGIAPLITALIAYIWLPESIKYLIVEGRRDAQIRSVLQKMEPRLQLPANLRFTVTGINVKPGISPAKLFGDGLAPITLLVWFTFAIGMMTNYFVATWLPTLLQSAGATTQQAAASAGLYSIGGMLGGLSLMRLIDRHGTRAYPYFFLLSMPCVAALGWTGLSPVLLGILATGAGITVSGMLMALNTTLGIIYPTPLRSKGIGWGLAIARLAPSSGRSWAARWLACTSRTRRSSWCRRGWQLLRRVYAFSCTTCCVKRFGSYALDDKAMSAEPAAIPASVALCDKGLQGSAITLSAVRSCRGKPTYPGDLAASICPTSPRMSAGTDYGKSDRTQSGFGISPPNAILHAEPRSSIGQWGQTMKLAGALIGGIALAADLCGSWRRARSNGACRPRGSGGEHQYARRIRRGGLASLGESRGPGQSLKSPGSARSTR